MGSACGVPASLRNDAYSNKARRSSKPGWLSKKLVLLHPSPHSAANLSKSFNRLAGSRPSCCKICIDTLSASRSNLREWLDKIKFVPSVAISSTKLSSMPKTRPTLTAITALRATIRMACRLVTWPISCAKTPAITSSSLANSTISSRRMTILPGSAKAFGPKDGALR